MSNIINKYIRKRGIKSPWNLKIQPKNKYYKYIFIIPAYAELNYLHNTIKSIDKQKKTLLSDTFTIIVINNGEDSSSQDIRNNFETLNWLETLKSNVEIGVIDASSRGLEIPTKYVGVGMARKIAMDIALEFSYPNTLFCCTDADTILEPNYLNTIVGFQQNTKAEAMVVGFSHQHSDIDILNKNIKEYESFLYKTADKIKSTGSPYGYVSIGSAMVCIAETYAAVGGMPRRNAAEDFYFLQECAKYCGVYSIKSILVHPSPRISERVHLGTGFRMFQANSGFKISKLTYSEKAFNILKEWIAIATSGYEKDIDSILMSTDKISPNFTEFIINEGIYSIWKGIQNSSPSKSHFKQQIHRWFDGLKTIRLLKVFSK